MPGRYFFNRQNPGYRLEPGMKHLKLLFISILVAMACQPSRLKKEIEGSPDYLNNRPPLKEVPYIELPLGSIRPKGWLLEQLVRQKNGLTGHLDERYAKVVGPRNGWLGGDGDGWERGPYWLDGLVPLAYTLGDSSLIRKIKPWIEWSLNHQQPDGYFGPVPFKTRPLPEAGLQKDKREDWWPKIVMLKVLKQYYEATGDPRVINLMLRYFRYQLVKLPLTPLDHWSFWANRRGGDNLMVVYWLYNITGEKFLLDLAELIHKQTYPWTQIFLNENCAPQNSMDHLYPWNTSNTYPFNQDLISKLCVSQIQSFHGVNLAQGIKEPVIYFQAHPDSIYIRAVKKAFQDIELFHGQAQGMYGADEPTHGSNPTQGIELCSIVEMMFSLEKMLSITGDVSFADHLEKIAFNALPTQVNDDYSARQYFQSANQVEITRGRHGFFEDDFQGGTDLCYGLLTGYPCCTCNLHQGWPKFTANLFYATSDKGLAALLFAPCEVNALAGDQVKVRISEETFYPFRDHITFNFAPERKVQFPFHIRIPLWCQKAVIKINGQEWKESQGGKIIIVNREWKSGDVVELVLPMSVTTSRWYMNSVAVERGPLVYSLQINARRNFIRNNDQWGDYWEFKPDNPWNYGLLNGNILNPSQGFMVLESGLQSSFPWNPDNAPVRIQTTGKIIPDWTLYHGVAGPMPHPVSAATLKNEPVEKLSLIPYGCTTLRLTEFPVIE